LAYKKYGSIKIQGVRPKRSDGPGETTKKFRPGTICRTCGAGWVKMMEEGYGS